MPSGSTRCGYYKRGVLQGLVTPTYEEKDGKEESLEMDVQSHM